MSITAIVTAAAIAAVTFNTVGIMAGIESRELVQGPSVYVQPESTPELGEIQDQREEFHQSYPLAANGRVAIENLNGDVRIKVWDQNEVRVDAVKRAYRRERLDEAKIEVSNTPDSIRIKTRYPGFDQTFTDDERGRYQNPATVDYTVTVPRQARLDAVELINGNVDIEGVEGDVKASSVNGRVNARGLTGEARLSTVNSTLEAVFGQLDSTKAVILSSVNGNVVLIIPSDSNAVLRASTVHGPINNDFGLNVQHGEYVGHTLYGQLGAGGARVRMGNVNGGISIKHAQDGRALSPASSLITSKEKIKEKEKEKTSGSEDEAITPEEARQIAAEARREALSEVDQARIQAQAQAEVQREVAQAMRESQREMERAQREVEREVQRRERERARLDPHTRNTVRVNGVGSRYVENESKSFAVSGVPRVSVATYDGVIAVHGWDKPEVMYSASKRSSSDEGAKKISIRSEQQGSAISIIANSEDGDGSASLEIYVPRNTTLHLSSDDGRLSVEGVSGDLTLRTGDGPVEVTDGRGQLQVNTGDGRIRIANFDGQVNAQTGDGSITLDGKFTAVSARTGDGSIALAVPTDLDFTIETNADAVTNQGLTITEVSPNSGRVKRWRVGRGGSVFILNTGEGRVILRPR